MRIKKFFLKIVDGRVHPTFSPPHPFAVKSNKEYIYQFKNKKKMKTLNQNEIDAIIAAIGNEPSTTTSLPKAGDHLTIKDMKVQPGIDLTDENGVLTGEKSKPWVKVDFEQGGSLSLNGILRSPDLTWDGLDNNTERIKALCAGELVFTHQESLTSRQGRPYKRNHFIPQTFKAEVGEAPKATNKK